MRRSTLLTGGAIGLLIIGLWGLARWAPALRYRFQGSCNANPCLDAGVLLLVVASVVVAGLGVVLAVAAVLSSRRASSGDGRR